MIAPLSAFSPELGQTSAHRRSRSWPARRGGRRVGIRRRSVFIVRLGSSMLCPGSYAGASRSPRSSYRPRRLPGSRHRDIQGRGRRRPKTDSRSLAGPSRLRSAWIHITIRPSGSQPNRSVPNRPMVNLEELYRRPMTTPSCSHAFRDLAPADPRPGPGFALAGDRHIAHSSGKRAAHLKAVQPIALPDSVIMRTAAAARYNLPCRSRTGHLCYGMYLRCRAFRCTPEGECPGPRAEGVEWFPGFRGACVALYVRWIRGFTTVKSVSALMIRFHPLGDSCQVLSSYKTLCRTRDDAN